MSNDLDRESLRARFWLWSEHERRIALERVVERMPDADLETVFGDLICWDEHRGEPGFQPRSLLERIERHVAATRLGEFRGEYELRNAHGQREPWQTSAWVAATGHLFALALERVRIDAGADEIACLKLLTGLVNEVDDRVDELIVFEEEGARFVLACGLDRARAFLDLRSSAGHDR